ncbi:thiamine phosphate synthase [Rubricoccus marinus]|uniref:Thiamine-phosphate synthase n=1 Tax=Rubricoccus marinus TaxID=716817 RepID=A0A259TWA4_9BACT|nr:thiamine phosphate synthase [Rubricoccus marinus]OZC02023.1 thiamine-phosphate diphosphorylase [Rubricoccus marinus]
MTAPPVIGRLHVLTDFHFQQRYSHGALARLALAGGAETIQFRQKVGSPRDAWVNVRPVIAACRDAGATSLVDDRLGLALGAGADGVHLGQTDLPLEAARTAFGARGGIIGATATTAAQAQEAEASGADYIGFGPVFPTGSKANPARVKGLDGLAEACAAVSIPVIAIAGITPERVAPCLDAGAMGVAVMTAVSCAPDPQAAAAAFREAIERWG